MFTPLLAGLGTQEIIIILLVVLLLFGAKKLPELARGTGQALRIFKAETKALSEDDKDKDDDSVKTQEQLDVEARAKAEQERRTQPDA
jgi:sec-independent protein translocase protein TatA